MSSSRTQGSRPVAYISGPLQAAADIEQARRFYELLAKVCCACGCEAYLPHQRTDPVHHAQTSARAVFARDLNAVSAADLIVAYVGAPSSGVGAELGIAHERRIPVIGLCGPEGVASRFIEGLLDSAPEARLVRYRDEDDCRRLLATEIESFVERWQPTRPAGSPQRLGDQLRDSRQPGRSPAPS
jgi:nucleoside 2-deoxyribosyltransferase